MSLKRRSFLGLIGAALAAPLVPMPSAARAAATAAPTKAALHGAILHARTQSSFSVWGLSKTLNVSVPQAETLMVQMAERGILGPLQGSSASGRWAVSRILQRPFGVAPAARKVAQQMPKFDVPNTPYADMRPFLRHLYDLCQSQGMTLHPRCAALLKG